MMIITPFQWDITCIVSPVKPETVHSQPPQVGILLCNTGTPAAPTAQALRPYLKQFLSDRRIIEWSRWFWWPLLHGIILNTRPARSARLYQRIWTPQGSPLLQMMKEQAEGMRGRILTHTSLHIPVVPGMRYGEPSIAAGLRQLRDQGVRRILIFPLFPQYSATTTASMFDAVFDELKQWRWLPEIRTIAHYHDHPGYITALAHSVRATWATTGQPEQLLFSYHGIPQSYFLKGDPYYCECQKTSRLVADQLGLSETQWQVTFQSRFGPEEWLRPYTDVTLTEYGAQKCNSLQVICPGFSSDCLETVDEIDHEGRKSYEEAGGRNFHYIPALNAQPEHLDLLATLALNHLQGWLDQPPFTPPDPILINTRRQQLGV